MRDKETSLKEKLRQALTSTVRVISDDLEVKKKLSNDKKPYKFDFFELENLNNKNDFIKARADSDSKALKKKFSDDKIYRKNLPNNSNYKSLYAIAEKTRYETLGGRMLKGIKKNFVDNYNQMIISKKKEQFKTKEDVPVAEAFELYMLKNFHNIKLNSLNLKILNCWEKEFDQSISNHIGFLKDNLENQNTYSSKFSEIFQKMDIFQNENNDESKEENQDNSQDNPSNDDQDKDTEDQKDQNENEKTEASFEADYDIDKYKTDEQFIDSDVDQQKKEEVIQKINTNDINLDI